MKPTSMCGIVVVGGGGGEGGGREEGRTGKEIVKTQVLTFRSSHMLPRDAAML